MLSKVDYFEWKLVNSRDQWKHWCYRELPKSQSFLGHSIEYQEGRSEKIRISSERVRRCHSLHQKQQKSQTGKSLAFGERSGGMQIKVL